jgi:hypothetical protein
MRGLDPRIHADVRQMNAHSVCAESRMDCRVKPGNDD